VPKTPQKEIFLISELGIETRFVHTCGLFEVLKASSRKPLPAQLVDATLACSLSAGV